MRHLVLALAVLSSTAALAQNRPPPAAPLAPQPPAPLPPGGPGMFHTTGIPPQLAQKLGINPDVVRRVRELGFEANEQLIPLEADLKRAQLDLERTLAQSVVDEGQVLSRVEVVGRAELGVRKNRMSLMLRIRKLLGPDTWEKLQAEMPGPGGNLMMMAGPGGGVRHEVRVIKRSDGTTEVTEQRE